MNTVFVIDAGGKMSKRDLIDIPFNEIIHQTDKAVLFDIGDEEVWLSKGLV